MKNILPFFSRKLVVEALKNALRKLNPQMLRSNPVIGMTAIVASLAIVILCYHLFFGLPGEWGVALSITLSLWLTVLAANFAESLAEGHSRAYAALLRQHKTENYAKRLSHIKHPDKITQVAVSMLEEGDLVLVEAGDIIPADGEVVQGISLVDESAITGESAPVIRESGGSRSAVTGGTRLMSDSIIISITARHGESFIDHMTLLTTNATRQKTKEEIALNSLFVRLGFVCFALVFVLLALAFYTATFVPPLVFAALLVVLSPVTVAALLPVVAIAGIDRLAQNNIIAKSSEVVEAARKVAVLLVDKTGTLTVGNRVACQFIPVPGVTEKSLAEAAFLSSLGDETPEGKSIVALAVERFGFVHNKDKTGPLVFMPFSAHLRMSGVDGEGVNIRKGAIDAILDVIGGAEIYRQDGELYRAVEKVSKAGGTPIAVIKNNSLLGIIHLKDVLKTGLHSRFQHLRLMGIRTLMMTGDNLLTAAAIAAEAGVDDFLAEVTPAKKLEFIRREQSEGKKIGMCGDGSNDAPALAQADVGIAMSTGTQVARGAGNIIDLDSNPTKMIELVLVSRQIDLQRRALACFSFSGSLAILSAVLPAALALFYPQLTVMNMLHLPSLDNIVMAAALYHMLAILALMPQALGKKLRFIINRQSARRYVFRYGVIGFILPLLVIALLDSVLA